MSKSPWLQEQLVEHSSPLTREKILNAEIKMAEQSATQRRKRQKQAQTRLTRRAIARRDWTGADLSSVIPTDIWSNIVSFVDPSDVPFLASTNRAMTTAVRRHVHMLQSLSLTSVPDYIVDNPVWFGRFDKLKHVDISNTRAYVLDLSRTNVQTLKMQKCRFSDLKLPVTLHTIQANNAWISRIDLSYLNLNKIDFQRLIYVDFMWPERLETLSFLRLRKVQVMFDSEFFSLLQESVFPHVTYLELSYMGRIQSENPIIFINLDNFPALTTLHYDVDLIRPDAVIPQVKHLIAVFKKFSGNQYASFPNVETMAAIIHDKRLMTEPDTLVIPPQLETLILQCKRFIPRYWEFLRANDEIRMNPPRNLVVYIDWNDMPSYYRTWMRKNEFYEFYRPQPDRIPFFRFGFSARSRASDFYKIRAKLAPFSIDQSDRTQIASQMAHLLKTPEFDVYQIEENDDEDDDRARAAQMRSSSTTIVPWGPTHLSNQNLLPDSDDEFSLESDDDLEDQGDDFQDDDPLPDTDDDPLPDTDDEAEMVILNELAQLASAQLASAQHGVQMDVPLFDSLFDETNVTDAKEEFDESRDLVRAKEQWESSRDPINAHWMTPTINLNALATMTVLPANLALPPPRVVIPYESLSLEFKPWFMKRLHWWVLKRVPPWLLEKQGPCLDRFIRAWANTIAIEYVKVDPNSFEDPRILWAMQDLAYRIVKANWKYLPILDADENEDPPEEIESKAENNSVPEHGATFDWR